MSSGHKPAQDSSPGGHLGLVQGLGLSFAPLGDLLILGLDLKEDVVQMPVVVHGQYHVGVIDQLLPLGPCSRIGISPLEMLSTHI